MTADDLEAGKDFGRYLDVDGDGIPYRTLPGTHPSKGSFFTRGTSRDRYARYTEEGAPYADNMQRLLRKFETAKDLVPRPLQANAEQADQIRRHLLRLDLAGDGRGHPACSKRTASTSTGCACAPSRSIRASSSFIADHDFVFVVEQNRDAQLRSLIVNECSIDPVRLVPILHYDGTPITARFIARAIGDHLDALKITPLRKVGVMTYVVKPKFHHPELPKNKLGFTHRDYEGSVSTLCAGCGHDFDLVLDHRGLLRAVDRAAPGGEAFRHRLLVEDADLFPRQFAWLQLGARAHAVGAHRRQSRQPRPDLSWRVGRRRLAPRSASASSRTRCAAASTWSTSSRTTACMG